MEHRLTKLDTTQTKINPLGAFYIGQAPATCGELVQGTLNGKDFLINSPIDLYAKVKARVIPEQGIQLQPKGEYQKVEKAVSKLLFRTERTQLGFEIGVESRLPRGKGLASSTSEMAASIQAVTKSLGLHFSPPDFGKITTSIESSDAVYYPGVVRCNQLTGEIYEKLGSPPPLGFVILDCGGFVDTNSFDRERARAISRRFESHLIRAVSRVKYGFQMADPKSIAEGASLSAAINQHVLYKSQFEPLLQLAKENGGLGVNCAHTGTILGVLYDPRVTDANPLKIKIGNKFGKENILGNFHLISGGAI